MPAWNWSHGSILSGTSVTITVTASPCQPVTVKLTVGAKVVGTQTISSPPGSVEISVPSGSTGQGYRLDVSCNGQLDVHTGVVG